MFLKWKDQNASLVLELFKMVIAVLIWGQLVQIENKLGCYFNNTICLE